MTHPDNRTAAPIDTQPGFLLGLVFGFIVGSIVGGILIIGQAQWSVAMEIGKQRAIHAFDSVSLSACARMLREQDMHQSQLDSCAFFIERTLIHTNNEYLVDMKHHELSE